MKKLLALACAALVAFAPFSASAQPVVGQPAPEFTAVDSNGTTHNLAAYKGKTVVLEWTNNECPFVKKHYDSGNMQALQKKAAEEGVVWLSVISSASGKQGHVDGAKANDLTATRNAVPAAVLLDETGVVGKAYDAKTTPHMFVIDQAGVLVYAGAIDNIASADKEDIAKAKNFVTAALEELKAGAPVSITTSKPYGCAVKY